MNKKSLNMILSALLTATYLQQGVAQESPENLWLSGGLGIGSSSGFGISSERGMAGKLELSYEYGKHTVSVRYARCSEVPGISVFGGGGGAPLQYRQDTAVLYGIFGSRGKWVFTLASVGLGLVKGNKVSRELGDFPLGKYEAYEEVSYSTAGIAFDAQANFTPLSVFGLGLDLLGNLNAKNSFVCLLLTVQLGKVN